MLVALSGGLGLGVGGCTLWVTLSRGVLGSSIAAGIMVLVAISLMGLGSIANAASAYRRLVYALLGVQLTAFSVITIASLLTNPHLGLLTISVVIIASTLAAFIYHARSSSAAA